MLSRSLVDHYTSTALHHHPHIIIPSSSSHHHSLGIPTTPASPPILPSAVSQSNPFMSTHPFFLSKVQGHHLANPGQLHHSQASLHSLSSQQPPHIPYTPLSTFKSFEGSLSPSSTEGENSIIDPLIAQETDIKPRRSGITSSHLNFKQSSPEISGNTSSESDQNISPEKEQSRVERSPSSGKKSRLSKSVS